MFLNNIPKFTIQRICLDSFSNHGTTFSRSISLFIKRIETVLIRLQLWVVAFCWVWSPFFFLSVSGVKRGVCSQINHFPEDADFDHDGAEYVLRKLLPEVPDVGDVEGEQKKQPENKLRAKYKMMPWCFKLGVLLLILSITLRNKHVTRFTKPWEKGCPSSCSMPCRHVFLHWYDACVPVHT